MTVTQRNGVGFIELGCALLAFEHVSVPFTLRAAGDQAHLLLARADGSPLAFEQMSWDVDAWRITLELRPGTYRYRYYVSDGRSTAYFSPAETDPVGRTLRMEGMDGVFDVAPALARTNRAGWSAVAV